MIISASRRTDIPAYYAEWLAGRFDAGFCIVRNPFDARRVTRVSLAPEDVDFLVLWTRDPRPAFPLLADLDARGIRSYLHMTITAYPASIEPGALAPEDASAAFRELSLLIGKRRALWRYDPIFVADGIDADFHRRSFERIASTLEGATERVTLSLLDEYAGTASRLARAGFPRVLFGSAKGPTAGGGRAENPARQPPDPYPALLADLASIARSRGIEPLACAEPYALESVGIEAGACIDASLATSLWDIANGSALRLAVGCANGSIKKGEKATRLPRTRGSAATAVARRAWT